jgi:hypothetical protein
VPRPDALDLDAAKPIIFELGADQYRRSEESWDEAGRPTARVELCYVPAAGSAPNELHLLVDVRKAEPLTFAAEDAVNPYDNESPDINGDGVQLYIADAFEATGQVLIPVAGPTGEVRVRVIDEWTSARPISAVWRPTRDGWALQATIPLTPCPGAPPEFALGIVVNEKPPGRDRRRGQLVLGGVPGGFVYLRGDREDRERLPRFRIAG